MAPRFELLECAGSGGSAEVWRAMDRARGCAVALKLERDAAARAALAREAEHAALALSPRLPELVDVGWLCVRGRSAYVEGGARLPGEHARAFVALRWVEGRPAAEACR
ncbi:MAG: hypothetical protein IT372_02815, partial [Polyangiaceae bacterium]|nr:hypothetical protein [Polyangiaceae bacterium]